MKKTRILALPAVAAASLLALTGCFQLPPPSGNGTDGNGGTSQAPVEGTEGGEGTETEGGDLAGTSWTGAEMSASGSTFAEFDFTLNEDGTIDITMWNDGSGFDDPADVWSGDASNLSMTITALGEQGSEERFDITFTGPAEGGQMELTGDGPDGTWTVTATQG